MKESKTQVSTLHGDQIPTNTDHKKIAIESTMKPEKRQPPKEHKLTQKHKLTFPNKRGNRSTKNIFPREKSKYRQIATKPKYTSQPSKPMKKL